MFVRGGHFTFTYAEHISSEMDLHVATGLGKGHLLDINVVK